MNLLVFHRIYNNMFSGNVIRFSQGRLSLKNSMDEFALYRRRSVGWISDPPAYIHPRILFGSGGPTLTPHFVNTYNITHVINCAFQNDSPEWFKTSVPSKYACLEAVDSTHASILYWYPRFEEIMRKFLSEEGSKTIYVHCQCGINRSGFLSLLFACVRLQYDYNEVIKSILSQRPCALTNPAYLKQVKEYCMSV